MKQIKGGYWSLKIIAVLMAVILWVYVSNDINPTTQQAINRVPLETRGVPADVSIIEIPGSVNLRVQGPRESVQQIGVRSVEAFVDLSGLPKGKVRAPVRVKVPEGVTVTEINPREVEVWLDTIIEKQVPLSLQKTGYPAGGYKLLDPVFDPARVIVKGPESIVEGIERALVKVNFNGSTEGFHGKLPIQPANAQGNEVTSNLVNIIPSRVDVFVPVVLDVPSKLVPIKPLLEGQPAPGFIVSNIVPELATISVFGPQDLVQTIDKVSTSPVSVEGATADVYQDVSLALPAGLQAGTTTIKVLVKIVPENQ